MINNVEPMIVLVFWYPSNSSSTGCFIFSSHNWTMAHSSNCAHGQETITIIVKQMET